MTQTEGSLIHSWADVERRARYCPVMAQVALAANCLGLSREQALISAVLYLSHAREDWIKAECDRLSNSAERAWRTDR